MNFSIVVPSLNQAAYLEVTLQSVLNQSGYAAQLIVNDGGSTDGSVDILRRYGDHLQWTSAPDHGQASAINQGLQMASGEIFAYLNSDDIYFPGALERVAAIFKEEPDCDILYGDAHHLHADGTFMEKYPTEPWNYARLFETCYLCQPAVFWRRSLHARHGFFDERLHFAMDYDFWLRVGAATAFRYLPGNPLAGSRLHADTKTLRNRVAAHREILHVVRRHAQRSGQCYPWLRHLATLTAIDLGAGPSPHPLQQQTYLETYLRVALLHADEFRLELDEKILAEFDSVSSLLPPL